MFSLIITIISIALVTALALATIYYGGSAFRSGQADAAAAKVSLQGQQLLGAAELFRARENRWPVSVDEMVAFKYLKSAPVALGASPGLMSVAVAAGQTWVMPVGGNPVFTLASALDKAACASFNSKSYGKKGIPENAYTGYGAQCYGASDATLTVAVSRASAAELVEALPTALQGVALANAAYYVQPPTSSTGPDQGSGGGTPPPVAAAAFLTDALAVQQFGTLGHGTSSNQLLTLTNDSAVVATFSGTPTGSPDFAVVRNNCLNVAPQGQCGVELEFNPRSAGAKAANLSISGRDISLLGEGIEYLNVLTLHLGQNDNVDWGSFAYKSTGNYAIDGSAILAAPGELVNYQTPYSFDRNRVNYPHYIHCGNTVGYDSATGNFVTGSGSKTAFNDSCYVAFDPGRGWANSPMFVKFDTGAQFYVYLNIVP